jgi:uncharacterized protein
MRIAVVGGNGFIGTHLVKRLVERGDQVMVFTRKPPKYPSKELWTYKLKPLQTVTWDPNRLSTEDDEGLFDWEKALEVADVVINLAGKGIMDERWSPGYLHECRDSRVKPTELIGKFLTNGRSRATMWINASAIGIYGMDTGEAEIDETSPVGDDVLARMCVEWEDATKPAHKVGIRVLYARFGLVLGLGGGMLAKMLPMFNSFLGGPLGSGKQFLSWVHIEDVAQSIMHMIDHKTYFGPFNITAPEPETMNTFAKDLGSSLERPAIFAVPSWALRLGLGEKSEALLGGQKVRPRVLTELGYSFRYPTLKSALEDLVAQQKAEKAKPKERDLFSGLPK